MHTWIPETRNNTLNEMRGSPFYIDKIPALASYFPQNCVEIKNYEQTHNPLSKDHNPEEGDSEDDEEEGDVKRHSATRRSNFGFWLSKDIEKVKRLLASGARTWPVEPEPIYKINPNPQEVIQALDSHTGYFLEFDIETDFVDQNLLCFGFTFWCYDEANRIQWDRIVYSVPVLDYNWRIASPYTYLIIRSLIGAIERNVLCAHNGAGFDFLVLAIKYNIPVYRVYDSMVAQHRIYPEIEKSLGHCVSLWTYQKFHKDEGSWVYNTYQHMVDMMKYNAKDVFTMTLIHQAQNEFARTIPGLSASIDIANRSLIPYTICTLTGIKYSEEKVKEKIKENDELMMQYVRIINILIGPAGMEECKRSVKSGKAKLFPGSNVQCCNYFHDQLGYPVVDRSSITGKPSLGAKSLYKLALKFPDNPVILFTCLYRQTLKETGALKFNPWKGDDGKILPRIKEDED